MRREFVIDFIFDAIGQLDCMNCNFKEECKEMRTNSEYDGLNLCDYIFSILNEEKDVY